MALYINLDGESNVYAFMESNNRLALDKVREEFSFVVPGHQFMQSFKRGKWDGRIRLANVVAPNTLAFPRGLLPDVARMFANNEFGELRITGVERGSDRVDYTGKFMEWLGQQTLPFEPDDYQISAAIEIINHKRRIVESPTSSGKTFIIWLAVQFLIDHDLLEGKILVVVPKLYLLKQFYDDMVDEFGMDPKHIHQLRAENDEDKKLVVSTWQKIYNRDGTWFDQFEGVFIDEAHESDGKSLMGIMEKCVAAAYRVGLTGSLKDGKVNELQLRGMFGKIVTTTTTSELLARGRVAALTICSTLFDYTRLHRSNPDVFQKSDYQSEIKLLRSIKARDRAVYKILDKHKDENSLVLFRFNDHGRRMYEGYKKLHPDKEVFFIDGGVHVDDRVRFAKAMDSGARGIVIFASLGTTSTGVSIKNIDIGIIATPVKSKTTVLQMIGRYLRKSKTKLKALIYDIADDLFPEGQQSYCMLHAESRLDRYLEIGCEITEEIYVV